jgi:hypothetical protein
VTDPTIGGRGGEAKGPQKLQQSEAAEPESESRWRYYRAHLAWLEEESQGLYDRAVLTLSGGAIGVSLVVVKDYLKLRGGVGSVLIALALLCWGLSVFCTLFSSARSRKVLSSAVAWLNEGLAPARINELSGRVASRLNTASSILFLLGVTFFAIYVAIEPTTAAKQQAVSSAPEEIARLLSTYDTIREVCPDCSAVEARKVLQVCEGGYMVPDVIRDACPRCTDKGIVELNHRCMEKWDRAR